MQDPHRKTFGNFFIKKSLQMRLILKVVVAALVATFICSGTLLLVYYNKYDSVLLYQMDQLANLTKENIIFIILPSLLISSLVNFIIAVAVGLYASRKYAVPIYKLEQWAKLIRKGKIHAKVQFRERDEMRDLSDECNNLTKEFKDKFLTIKTQTQLLKEHVKDSREIDKIEAVLATLDLDSQTLQIHTTSFKIDKSETS